MARTPPELTPIEAYLAPLGKLALQDPLIEALVFWEADGWPDAPSEALESEEIVFYAEGLLEEGFRMDWRVVASPDAPQAADHVRLYVWEDGAAAPPAATADWPVLASDTWGGR